MTIRDIVQTIQEMISDEYFPKIYIIRLLLRTCHIVEQKRLPVEKYHCCNTYPHCDLQLNDPRRMSTTQHTKTTTRVQHVIERVTSSRIDIFVCPEDAPSTRNYISRRHIHSL